MGFRRITLSNFKTFGKEVDVSLGGLNVLIGANAAGKSNFIRAFEFLRDLGKDGLDAAVFQQGDVDFLSNMEIGRSSPFSLRVEMDLPSVPASVVDYHGGFLEQRITGVTYSLKLALNEGRPRPLEEALHESFSMFERQTADNMPGSIFERDLGQGELSVSAVDGTVRSVTTRVPVDLLNLRTDWIAPNLTGFKLEGGGLLVNKAPFFPRELICDVGIFDVQSTPAL